MENQLSLEPKVSVIMPVYNVSAYLKQALDSVVNQTLTNIEIICVDDGSTDDSLEILQEYAGKDDRIQVITQKNQYAGVARNNGLSKAKGKYVIFWDADDFFELDALEKLYDKAEEEQAEVVVCGANRYDEELDETILTGIYMVEERLPEKRPFSREDMGKYIFYFATNVPWNKLYLREYIIKNNLQFEARKKANDTYFVIMAFYYAERISVVTDRLINYRINNMTGITNNTYGEPLCAYESYVRTLEELETKDDYSGELKQSFINRALSGFMTALANQNNFTDYKVLYEMLLGEGFKRFEIEGKEQEFFFSPWMYEDYQRMSVLAPEDFLLDKMKRKSEEVKLKNSKMQRLRIRREELKVRRDELKEERSRLKEELREQKQIVKQQKSVLESRTVRYALKLKQTVTLNGRLGRKKA